MMDVAENIIEKLLLTRSNNAPMDNANAMPKMPPMKHTITASIKNCCMMSDCRAPTAMRTPISWVRSVTETSMMFITPMPPTMSEITAIIETNSVMVCVVDSMVWRMVSLLER